MDAPLIASASANAYLVKIVKVQIKKKPQFVRVGLELISIGFQIMVINLD